MGFRDPSEIQRYFRPHVMFLPPDFSERMSLTDRQTDGETALGDICCSSRTPKTRLFRALAYRYNFTWLSIGLQTWRSTFDKPLTYQCDALEARMSLVAVDSRRILLCRRLTLRLHYTNSDDNAVFEQTHTG